MRKTQSRDTKRAALVKKAAEITGYSERYINYVRKGDRDNNTILTVLMELQEGENALVKAVKQLVPLEK